MLNCLINVSWMNKLKNERHKGKRKWMNEWFGGEKDK